MHRGLCLKDDIKKIVVYGAGGHGQVVADILICMQRSGKSVLPVGFIDDNPGLKHNTFLGISVFGSESELPHIAHDALVVAIGNNETRKKVAMRMAAAGEKFFAAIHPSAVIAADTIIGQGCMICAGAVVNTGSVIGDHVILNTGCTVDHHNHIGNFVHIAPGVNLGGEVQIDEGVLTGIGSCVLPRTSIGAWAVIGGGGVVRKNIPAGALAVGNPCRVVKIMTQNG